MPAPHRYGRFSNSAFDIGGNGCFRPLKHRLVVGKDSTQAPDSWDISDGIGVVDVMPIGSDQRAAEDLMNSHQQLARRGSTEHLLNETVDFGIPEGVNVLESYLLFVEPLAEQTSSVAMIENVPTRLQFYLKLANRQRPRAERMHQPALEVEEAEQSSPVFFNGILAAQSPSIPRETVRIRASPLFGGGPMLLDRDSGYRGLSAALVRAIWTLGSHKVDEFAELLDPEEFNLKNQGAIGRNFRAGTVWAVGKVRRNHELEFIPHFHELKTFGPSRDDSI
jgi:hypothetical protein